MKNQKRKAPFLAAYDEKGNYICDYLVVKMGKGKSAVLPITKRMNGYYHKLLRPYLKGTRKVVWHGWMVGQLNGMVTVSGQRQENGFYMLMKPLIEGQRRGKRVDVLKRIGAFKSPKTL